MLYEQLDFEYVEYADGSAALLSVDTGEIAAHITAEGLSMPRFNFDDLKPQSETFAYLGKQYTISEATEDANIQYRNAINKGTEVVDGEPKLDYEAIAEADSVLVAACLTGPDGPVTHAEVRKWQHQVVKKLYEWVKEVSDIGVGSTVEELDKQIDKLQKAKERLAKGN